MRRAWLAFPALSLLALGANAADNGLYVGLSVGQGNVDVSDDVSGFELDGEDVGYKGIIGFRPLDFLAFELNYVDLGNLDDTFLGTKVELKSTGLDVFVVGLIPLPFMDIFGKVGAIAWDAEISASGFGTIAEDDGEDLAYGAGVQFRFGSAAIRAEYEIFEIDDLDDVNMLSLGVTWTFL